MTNRNFELERRDAIRLLGLTITGGALAACGLESNHTINSPTSPTTSPTNLPTTNPSATEASISQTEPVATSGPPTLRTLSDDVGLKFAVLPMPSRLWLTDYRDATLQIGNELIGDDLACKFVYRDVDWRQVLNHWDLIQEEFSQGRTAFENQIRWDPWNRNYGYMAGFVDFAAENNMTICVDSLLWSDDVPESVREGNFTRNELRKIAEFMLKNKLIMFKDIVREWSVISESPARHLWGDWHSAFWERNLGYPDIVYDAFRWARDVAPDARLNLMEDHIDATDESRARTLQATLDLLDSMNRNNIPADGFSFENNLWIYAPPQWDEVRDVLQRIRSMGYLIGHAQTTVVLSEVWPIYPSRQRTVWNVSDKLAAQADIYARLLQEYLEVDGDFGVFGVSDQDSWYQEYGADDADPLLFDRECQPKPCYDALVQVLEARLAEIRE